MRRSQLFMIIGVVVLVLVFIGVFSFFGKPAIKEKVKLTIWGIEDRAVFESNFNAYRKLRTNVEITYEQFNPDEYEDTLIDALAAGKGPDVMMFSNRWLPKHWEKIKSVSETQFNLKKLQDLFGRKSVIEQDFAPDGLIFALPLYIDTLALYYNLDIFNSSGIALPPATWNDFQNLIPKLRQISKAKEIKRAAGAIGGSSKSINNAADILSLLMLQNGAKMTDDNFSQATFASRSGNLPGLDALDFYVKFSDRANTLFYTWNNDWNALDSFAQGNTAMIFDYAAQKQTLKKSNPFLNFAAAPMPQISSEETAVNYASYYGLAVSNKSSAPEWAWDLIIYLTADETAGQNYLGLSGRPPALRSLIDKYLENAEMGVFAKQALSARSWPQIDDKAVSAIFSQMLEAVIEKKMSSLDAIDQAESAVSNLMRAKK